MTNLKRHLMSKKHGWNEENASRALSEFGLRKERNDKKRNIQSRKNENRICCICSKTIKRIGNHLRQTHHKSNNKAKELKKKCLPVITADLQNSTDSSSANEITDSSEEEKEEQRKMQHFFMLDLHSRETAMLESCTDSDDEDWLGNKYTLSNDMLPESCPETRRLKNVDGDENLSDIHTGEQSISNDSEKSVSDIDYEDHDDNFIMSSVEEDELLKDFCDWLGTIDGSGKDKRQAMKHKSAVQAIVRSDGMFYH